MRNCKVNVRNRKSHLRTNNEGKSRLSLVNIIGQLSIPFTTNHHTLLTKKTKTDVSHTNCRTTEHQTRLKLARERA